MEMINEAGEDFNEENMQENEYEETEDDYEINWLGTAEDFEQYL